VSADESPLLELAGIRFGFPERPDFLGPVDLSVKSGECLAVVGPNGAGKSTLLRLMAGLLKPQQGEVRVDGQSLPSLSPRARARRMAFLPQGISASELDYSVREIVLMGRFPHRSWSLFESAEDHRIAEDAMATTATGLFADRPVQTLSGGEAQRVHIAAALAQQPDVLLLDEPTSSLDLQHQLGIFGLLHDLAVRDGLAVVVVTHDINLAARFGTKVLLMDNGRPAAYGKPEKVIKPSVLEPVYGVGLMVLTMSEGGRQRWIVPAGLRGEAPI
jgi:iron complex transport system ATP-binding protein